jgi:hypothetical protein
MAEQVKKKLRFWGSIKWFFTELMKIYSTKPSYFSKKRVESGIGFIIAEWGMIFFLLSKFETITMIEFCSWASIQFLVAGYMVNQIQSEKKTDVSNSDTTMEENQQ